LSRRHHGRSRLRPSPRRPFRVSASNPQGAPRKGCVAEDRRRYLAINCGRDLDLRGVNTPFTAATSAGSFFPNPRESKRDLTGQGEADDQDDNDVCRVSGPSCRLPLASPLEFSRRQRGRARRASPSHAASSRPSPMRRNRKDEAMFAKLKTLLRKASERSIEASGIVSANSATCWSCSAKSLATAIEDTLSLITAISELR
jgi:hypothetical protein